MNTYYIKNGYRINDSPKVYVDSEEDALTYQVDVYRYAADILHKEELSSVLDVGCGLGLKLREFILPLGVRITGVDMRESIDVCWASHDFGRWICDDIEHPGPSLGEKFDLIISADVVEHLMNPDALFDYLRACSHPDTLMLISTPDRDLRRGVDDMGPPGNPAHVQEWNSPEFRCYLEARGLRIIEHRIVDLRQGMATCQLALCEWQDKAGIMPHFPNAD